MNTKSYSSLRIAALTLVLFLLAACASTERPVAFSEVAPPHLASVAESSPIAIVTDVLALEGYEFDLDDAVVEDGVGIVRLDDITGTVAYSEEGDNVFAELTLYAHGGALLKQWPVCHVPPGNPSNAHTIFPGAPAVKTHLDKHGDTLGYCPNDPAAADVSIVSITLTSNATPYFVRLEYNIDGNLEVVESGTSSGTTSLEALTTALPERKDTFDGTNTKMAEFVELLKSRPSKYANRVLEVIPTSMGGIGPEVGTSKFGGQTANIITECGENGSECSDPKPEPEPEPGDDPEDGGTGNDNPDEGTPNEETPGEGGTPDGEEPGDGESDDDDNPDNGSGPSGPTYDEEELARLEGIVEGRERFVEALEYEKDTLERNIETEERLAVEAYENATEIIEGNEVPELEQEIEELIEAAEESKRVAHEAVVDANLAKVDAGEAFLQNWVKLPDAIRKVNQTNYRRDDAVVARDETFEERDAAIAERDALLDEATAQIQTGDVRVLNLVRAEGLLEDLEGRLETANEQLTEAREDLSEFKQENGID